MTGKRICWIFFPTLFEIHVTNGDFLVKYIMYTLYNMKKHNLPHSLFCRIMNTFCGYLMLIH